MGRKLKIENFIVREREIHGNRYDYFKVKKPTKSYKFHTIMLIKKNIVC